MSQNVESPTASPPTTVDGAAERIGALLRASQTESDEKPAEEPQDLLAEEPQAGEPEQEAAEDAAEATQESDAGQEAEPQDASSESTQDAENDADVIELDAEALAEHLGVPVNVTENGELRIRTKIDGKEGDATLQEMVRRYQTDATLSNRGKALEKAEKEHQARLDQIEADANQQHQVLAALLQSAQTDLNPFANINLDELRESDPAQYAATLADKTAWEQRMNGVISNAMNAYQQGSERLTNERTQASQQAIAREQEALTKLIPDFDDAMGNEIREWVATKYGVEPSDVVMPKAWMIENARVAMQAEKSKAKVAKKKVKKTPKFVKPGARRSATSVNAEMLQGARKALKKDGSVESAAAYFRALSKRTR
jgi:hypothetical protein